MKTDYTPGLIKFFAVVTAAPRWVVALMAAEGLTLPDEWLWWWIAASAIMAASMAVVEGVAFSYVFSAWRKSSGKASNILGALAFATAVIFVAVLSPYIAASVRGVALSEILLAPLALYIWSACVAASTIAIVASVGYAQKAQGSTQAERKPQAEMKQIAPVSVNVAQDTRKSDIVPGKPLAQGASTSDKVLAFYRDNPYATQAQAGEHCGVSRQAVSLALGKLEAQGVITRNGKVEVKG